MFKKTTALALLALIIIGSTAALAAGDTAPATTTMSLTVQAAEDLALKNNIDYLKAGIDYRVAVNNARAALSTAKEIPADSVESLNTAQTKYVTPAQQQLAEKVAAQTYAIAKVQTKNLVEENYFSLQKAQNIVVVKNAAVQRAQADLALVQNKFQAGVVAKTEVNRAQVSLLSAKADVANAQRDLQTAEITLKNTLGLDADAKLSLVDTLKYEPVTLPTLAELIQQALTNRLDLQKAKNQATIAQLTYQYVVGYQSPSTTAGLSAKAALDKANLDVKQQEQTAKSSVMSALFQIQKAQEVVQLAAQNQQTARDNYTLAQRRFQIGVGTNADVIAAEADLVSVEEQYVEAVYNYVVAKNRIATVIYTS